MSDPEVTEALNKMLAHPAFPAFKKHIENYLFRGTALVHAWCWFRDGWDTRTIKYQNGEIALLQAESERLNDELVKLREEIAH